MSTIRFTPDHLKWLNQKLSQKKTEDILVWCETTLPKLAQSTSFGPSGMVMMDLLHKLGVQLPTIYIDTLHHFPESLEHAQNCKEHYGLDLNVYACKGTNSREEFEKAHGQELWKTDPDQYDFLVKVEPQRRALRELDVYSWVNGRRRSQGGERSKLDILEFDADGRLKVNPLAYWTYGEVWDYIHKNKVPYNPLHDQGYKSIGDQMTTFPVKEGEDERAGRWSGSSKTECGIHIQAPSPSSEL